ncbi:hypothetical protein A3A14_01320 [Candidatus Daviesbacteria bacterium RIFCSPLOWO2_01_FULL_43_38]|uniref:2-phosphoglycerate kinase n=3 Tax=Candidatus Daviesiibacteriota TaxID=1752718 RepID=A0A1F5K881_9BACT|nr:MAG: hypothetical protein UV33_C0003G0005 [Candidatus Daviesbacteria bacterium GW2011_GWA1_42_6]KKS70278.1 MAG: hypothetical protein UV41_C0030G0010 [Candidatus Daviesbacteria bacterium GW2011_GWA2_42_7]OGE18984.1 MAG: hypothetical protein A2874_02395 [Candidatus Daviesbacteria bacterium RIFCSPHIGHO2_01_FULL_43_17]OGE36871.1 MAG: hypothetical protein A3E45_03445 [Candidatus Daviesbacteria bacterium RIFCSPHIGHO2_12_FULL_43_11]OGE63297.1 MAG: hypothetical protein A3A14_01320 [Candidatus Davies
MVYLIGGSIRIGKSNLAHKILQKKQISVISTDVIIGLLKDYVKKDFNDPRPNFIQKAENFYPYLKEFIRINLVLGMKDFVYEGDIILPEQVTLLAKEYKIKSCFLGFSHINLALLKEHIGNHQWLDELLEDELNKLPERIMDTSKFIEDECKKYHLKYFDLSTDYNREHELAYKYLLGE